MKKGIPHVTGVYFVHCVVHAFVHVLLPAYESTYFDVERSHIQFGSSYKNSGKPIPSQGSTDTSGDEEHSRARLVPYCS